MREVLTGETLAPVSDLQDYGASIIAELDKAEAELDASDNQPFSGLSPEVMRDMAVLRERQFDMFRRHVEIEQGYKIENAVADGSDVQRMSFSGIAKTMRKKEAATAGLLDKLAQFDEQLRIVIDKFEAPSNTSNMGTAGNGEPEAAPSPQRADVSEDEKEPSVLSGVEEAPEVNRKRGMGAIN